jgi:DNA-directed RNA polymerase specialized sigma24 family protein
VEDVIASAAHKILRSLDSYKYNFDTWVGVVARTTAMDYAKHLARRAAHEAQDDEPLGAAEATAPGSGDMALWADASAWAREDEVTRVIGTAIRDHARTDRDSAIAVLLTPEYSVAEIATKRGRSEATIRSWLKHDYGSLRQILGDRFGISHPGDILRE